MNSVEKRHRATDSFFVAPIWFFLTGLATYFYWEMRDSAFALDDPGLLNYLADPSITTTEKVFNTGANRWRPIANLGYVTAFSIFSNEFRSWWMLNMFVLGILGTLVWGLLRKAGAGQVFALAGGVLIVTSRFVSYQAIQATGLMEGIASILLILFLYLMYSHARNLTRTHLYGAVAAFLLLILTHERYQGLLLFAFIYLVFIPNTKMLDRLRLMTLFSAPVVFLTAMKVLVFRIPLLVGTGSSHHLGVSAEGVRIHSLTALMDVMGASTGPAYLVGLTLINQSTFQIAMSLTVVSGTALAMSLSSRNDETTRLWINSSTPVARLAVVCSLILSLLIPIVVTIRLEPRWLVGLYVALLVAMVSTREMTSRDSSQKYRHLWLVSSSVVVASSVLMNFHYRDALDGVYFRGAQRGVMTLLSQITPAWTEAQNTDRGVTLIVANADPNVGASFNSLVTANSKLNPVKVNSVASIDELMPSDLESPILNVDSSTGAVTRINGSNTPGVVVVGDIHADGWAGQRVQAVFSGTRCRVAEIAIEPAPWGNNSVRISGGGEDLTLTVDTSRVELALPIGQKGLVLVLEFQKVVVPSEAGFGDDVRLLSNQVQLSCAAKG